MTEQPTSPPIPQWSRRVALRGSAFELVGYGSSMVLRLAGNVLLSRLLFPKAFGLSAEVGFVLFGLTMLSDVGVRQCVIQSARGDDTKFLNTAFTLQVLRGLLITALGALLSYPAAHWLFREPEITPLLLASSCQQLITGFNSTSILTLRRHVRLGWVNVLDFAQQIIGLVIMVAWARVHPSVWALIVGSFGGGIFYLVASHLLPVGYRNRFQWDKEAYREFIGFGRWIFGSSSVSFLASQGDRALFGRLLGAAELGVYQIAAELAGSASAVVDRLISGVLYPMLSRTRRDTDISTLRSAYYRSRLALDALAQGGLGLLCGFGGWLVRFIWDPRYWDAAWMVRILCIRAALSCIVKPAEACLTGMGLPRFGLWRSLALSLTVWTALPIGFALGGVRGLLVGVVVSELPSFVVLWPKFYQLKLLRFERELLAVAFFVVAAGLGTALGNVLPAWHLPHHHH